MISFRLTQADLHLLRLVGECRVLRMSDLAVLLQRNVRALRRRLQRLAREHVVEVAAPAFGHGRGRPEKLVSLPERGVDVLRAKGILKPDVPVERVTAAAIHCVEHHLLVNAFRAQLAQAGRLVPALSTRFLSPDSPFLRRTKNGSPMVHERFSADDPADGWIDFTPDGVFSVTDRELGKTLLFFLEVDMGTQPLTSGKTGARDIRQKILNYQECFRQKRYKRYEKVWKCMLGGFRLLFLTVGVSRMTALCRLAREMRPSDFIWVSDRSSLASEGVWAPVWARGGRIEASRESILGSRSPSPCPPPADVT